MDEELNCPNCGAVIKHRYNHNCPYCGTFFDYRIRETEELDPRYFRNMKLKEIERVPYEDCFVLIFEGQYQKWLQPLEYGNINETMVIDSNSLIPKRVCFGLRISYTDLKNLYCGNFDFLEYKLPFEMDKENIYRAVYEYYRKNWERRL